MKKMTLTTAAVVIMICSMTGCGGNNQNETKAESTTETLQAESVMETSTENSSETTDTSAAESETEAAATETETEKQTQGEMSEQDHTSMIAAYKAALTDFMENKKFPNGDEFYMMEEGNMSENQFAIYDVDGDGIEELLINGCNTATAAMEERIYAYNTETGELDNEMTAFPNMTFYDNHMITVGVSHNQGLAGNFWPYTLYKYNEMSKTYEAANFVDAWDHSIFEKGYDDEEFPSDVDTDGADIVYYIHENFSGSDKVEPISQSDYTAWFDNTLNGATEVTMDYQGVTAENIDAIQ